MRSTLRSALVALMAVLALGAVATASASAATPEFTGTFPNTFVLGGTNGFSMITEGKHEVVSCGGTNTGELTAAKVAAATLAFTGCRNTGRPTCQTAGAKEGEVRTAALAGKLVSIDKGREVGIDFTPKTGTTFAEMECSGTAGKETLKVRGALILTVLRPVNTSTSNFRWEISQPAAGVEYENGTEKGTATLEIEGSGAEAFSFEGAKATRGVATLTTGHATELKASLASKGLPELSPTPQEFKGSIGSASLWIETFPSNFKEATISGKIVSPNEVADVVMKFKNISPANYGCATNELGGEAGELVTNELAGRLGYLNKATKTVGLMLEPTSGVLAKCHGYDVGTQEILGSIIGRLTPVAGGHSFKLEIVKGKTGEEQELTKFEGEEATHQLENYWVSGKKQGKMSMGTEGMAIETSKVTELKA
jgi:hypothetical protein